MESTGSVIAVNSMKQHLIGRMIKYLTAQRLCRFLQFAYPRVDVTPDLQVTDFVPDAAGAVVVVV